MAKVHLARHAIYNLNGKTVGYELLFSGDKGFDKEITSDLMATSKVLLNLLTHMDFEKVVGDDKLAFINIDHEVLFSGVIGLLKPDKYTLELSRRTEISSKLFTTLKRLRKSGFVIALDDFDCSKEMYTKFKPIFQVIDYIKVNASQVTTARQKKFLKIFKEYGIKTLAQKLETQESYRDAIALGYDLFQGFHFKKPEVIEIEVPKETTRSAILHMVSLVKQDKETEDLEEFVKTQPDLVYNLIKYLNSPSVAPVQEIRTIKHAIAMMGRKKLVRWLLLYIYSESLGEDIDPSLLKNAVNRAEKMQDKFLTKDEKEKGYLTGMFSLLDVVFNTPMNVIVRGLPIDSDILFALTSRSGSLGKALREVEDEDKRELLLLVNENFKELNANDVMKMLSDNKIDLSALTKPKDE